MVFKLFSHLMYAFLKIKGEFRAKYNDKFGDDERIRSAYLCIRKLSSIWSCYLEHISTRDGIWGDFNDSSVFGAFRDIQKMVSTVTYDIKAGTFLISHPLAAQHYKRSVILLLQHDNAGSQGIVINHQCEQSFENTFGYLWSYTVSTRRPKSSHLSILNLTMVKDGACGK